MEFLSKWQRRACEVWIDEQQKETRIEELANEYVVCDLRQLLRMRIVADPENQSDSQLFDDYVDDNNDACNHVRDHEHLVVRPREIVADLQIVWAIRLVRLETCLFLLFAEALDVASIGDIFSISL